jgi:hypothetical protein
MAACCEILHEEETKDETTPVGLVDLICRCYCLPRGFVRQQEWLPIKKVILLKFDYILNLFKLYKYVLMTPDMR